VTASAFFAAFLPRIFSPTFDGGAKVFRLFFKDLRIKVGTGTRGCFRHMPSIKNLSSFFNVRFPFFSSPCPSSFSQASVEAELSQSRKRVRVFPYSGVFMPWLDPLSLPALRSHHFAFPSPGNDLFNIIFPNLFLRLLYMFSGIPMGWPFRSTRFHVSLNILSLSFFYSRVSAWEG